MSEDRILLAALSKGSMKAFDALYRKYAAKVGRFSSALLCSAGYSRADVDDLVQEIFLKIWQKRETLAANVDNFNAYLFRMTKNAVLNILTREKGDRYSIDTACDMADDDDVLSRTITSDVKVAVHRAVDNMPDERQKVFLMSRAQGLSNKEIAERLNISTKTVEYHLGRAKSDIKKNLS